VLVGNQKNLMTRSGPWNTSPAKIWIDEHSELCNAIGVVPGAIGVANGVPCRSWRIFRDTLAEDAEPYSVHRTSQLARCDEPRARALTEPRTLPSIHEAAVPVELWHAAVAYKHPNFGAGGRGVTLVAIPNIFLFQFGFTLLAR